MSKLTPLLCKYLPINLGVNLSKCLSAFWILQHNFETKTYLCVLLTLSMSVNAFAMEVPTDAVVQNLNGSQQAIKTFTILPDQDPATLIEEPFELEG